MYFSIDKLSTAFVYTEVDLQKGGVYLVVTFSIDKLFFQYLKNKRIFVSWQLKSLASVRHPISIVYMSVTNYFLGVQALTRAAKLSGFICACHHAFQGLNPKYTIYAFSIIIKYCTIPICRCIAKRRKEAKRGRVQTKTIAVLKPKFCRMCNSLY